MRRPEAEGLIRFGAPDDYASHLLAPILAAIFRRTPADRVSN
jgi:DNA-binding transcriptional LysR family regulator